MNNLIKNNRKYKQTIKGVTAVLYSKILERSRNKGWKVEFTLKEFRDWFESHGGWEMYAKWNKPMSKPSVDRIDPLKPYVFENMQVLTALENRIKGDKEKIILWGIPVVQIREGDEFPLAIYNNILVASQMTGINKNNISSCINGKRKTAGGYIWKKKLEVIKS